MPVIGVPPGRARRFGAVSADPYRLLVGELFQTELGQLTAVARRLHAAEGELGCGRHHRVDEHGTGVDLLDAAGDLFGLVGPYARPEAEGGCVGGSEGG